MQRRSGLITLPCNVIGLMTVNVEHVHVNVHVNLRVSRRRWSCRGAAELRWWEFWRPRCFPSLRMKMGGRAGSEGRGEKGGGKEKETPLAQTDHYLLARAARTSLRISPFCHTSVLGSACTRYPSDTIAPLLSSSHLFRGCQCQKYAHMKGFSFTPSPPNPPPPFFFLFFF